MGMSATTCPSQVNEAAGHCGGVTTRFVTGCSVRYRLPMLPLAVTLMSARSVQSWEMYLPAKSATMHSRRFNSYVCIVFKEHGQSRRARYYADASNSCPACLRRCPTRTQLIRHMYNAKKCSAYPDHCVAVPVEEVARLDAEETARILRVAKASAYESCKHRRLGNVRGPLLQVFKDCYKGRPIFKVEDISGMG